MLKVNVLAQNHLASFTHSWKPWCGSESHWLMTYCIWKIKAVPRWPSIPLGQQQSGENGLPPQRQKEKNFHHCSWDTSIHRRSTDTMPNSRRFATAVGSESTGHPSCPHQDISKRSSSSSLQSAEDLLLLLIKACLAYPAAAGRPECGPVAVLARNPLCLRILWLKWATALCLPAIFHPFPSQRQKGWHIHLRRNSWETCGSSAHPAPKLQACFKEQYNSSQGTHWLQHIPCRLSPEP